MWEPLFLQSPLSSKVMIMLETEWGTLSTGQRASLLKNLAAILPLMYDELSDAIAFELLGEYFTCEESLPVLEALASNRSEELRLRVPHAVVGPRAPRPVARSVEGCLRDGWRDTPRAG
jgi:hypothetical protein